MCFTLKETLIIVALTVVSGADYEAMVRQSMDNYLKNKFGGASGDTGEKST